MRLTDYMCQEKKAEEDSVDKSKKRIKYYIEKRRGRLITATKNNTDYTRIKRRKYPENQNGKKNNYVDVLRLQQIRSCTKKTWTWLEKGNLKSETESLLIAAQTNAIRTHHIKARIDKSQQNSRCWSCGGQDEMISHIITKCSKLAHRDLGGQDDPVGIVQEIEV